MNLDIGSNNISLVGRRQMNYRKKVGVKVVGSRGDML